MNALADAQPHACATAVTGVFRSSMIRAWCRRSWVATGKGHAEVAAEKPPQGAFAGAYLLTRSASVRVSAGYIWNMCAMAVSRGSVGVVK